MKVIQIPYYASTLFGPIQTQPNSAPRPLKRQRLMAPSRLALTGGKLNGTGGLLGNPGQVSAQQQQQQLQLQAAVAAANSPSAAAAAVLGGYYGAGAGVNGGNGLPPGSVLGVANGGGGGGGGYLNNNGYLMNGDVTGTMASYTNGQHLVGPYKTYSNPDTLICGNCREMFTDLTELLDHKKAYCKLRFTCKCVSPTIVTKNKSTPPSAKLLCVACKDSFSNPWDLMVHAQAAHMVNIYELGDSSDEEKSSTGESSSSVSSADSLALVVPKRLHANGGASGEKNGGTTTNGNALHHDLGELDHDDKDKSCEQNEDSDAVSSNGGMQLGSSTEDIHQLENGHSSSSGGTSSTASSPSPSLPIGSSTGSVSSPNDATQPTRACIMTALSIDTKSNPEATVALKMVTSTLGISLTNGGATLTAATQ
ncbi:hypothetical protein quinque_003357 [Culex quinquefasciatus]